MIKHFTKHGLTKCECVAWQLVYKNDDANSVSQVQQIILLFASLWEELIQSIKAILNSPDLSISQALGHPTLGINSQCF